MRRTDPVFALILLVAFALRLTLAAREPYIHDENGTAIPLSQTIALGPDRWNLPLRGENHGALPAYVARASSTLFGTSALGYRGLHLLLGLATIALVARLAREWYGDVAARWAAALLAFNEFYLTTSARVTAHVPHLFLQATALYAFTRFLATERPVFLYAAGAATGLAFYCKEHAALLLPVFALALLRAPYRRWLWRPQVYAAGAVFALVIAPDLLWNLRTNPETARVAYGGGTVGQSTYRNHLARIGGLGFSPYPSMFYGREAVQALYRTTTGAAPVDETPEYRAMNPAIGALLLGGVLLATFRRSARDRAGGFLLVAFWFVFGFFTLIAKGTSQGRLDPASWIWVESTILSSSVLAGARLADARGLARSASWLFAVLALAIAAAGPARASAREVAAAGEAVRAAASHTLQTMAADTVAAVRARPLRWLALGVLSGAVAGGAIGFAGGRRTRAPRI